MERSWLQEQAALSKFDGFKDSESLTCVKPTAAPAPTSLMLGSIAPPEAGRSVDVVYDPQDSSADWSGFAPRHCARRRMQSEPAAHRETIGRSEYGIAPATDTATQDFSHTRRRRCIEPTRAGEGLVLAGPSAVDSKERFMTCARAANEREPTPAEMKSEGWRYKTTPGRKRVTPAYDPDASNRVRIEQRMTQAGNDLWSPPGAPLRYPQGDHRGVYTGRARTPHGPGSLLQGLGQQLADFDLVSELYHP